MHEYHPSIGLYTIEAPVLYDYPHIVGRVEVSPSYDEPAVDPVLAAAHDEVVEFVGRDFYALCYEPDELIREGLAP